MPLVGEPRVFVRPGPVPRAADGQDQAADPEFAAEPDGRRDSARKICAAIADMVRGSRRDGAVATRSIRGSITTASRRCPSRSFPGMLEKTIILDGFSKTYAMTGWRMGYGVMPMWLVEAVTKLMVNSNSCTASFTQRAGIAALKGRRSRWSRMVAEFRRRRDAICRGLNRSSRFPLRASRRRVLRVREREGNRMFLEGISGSSAGRGGRRLARWRVVRPLRRRIYPVQLCQFAREFNGGGSAD